MNKTLTLTRTALAALLLATAATGWAAEAARRTTAAPTIPDKENVPALAAVARANPKGKPAAPAPVLPSMSAEAIVERNAQARGGAAAWSRITAMQLSGLIDAGRERKDGGNVGGLTSTPRQARLDKRAEVLAAVKTGTLQGKMIQLPYRLELQRPNRERLEIDFNGQTALQVWDGRVGWKYRPFIGRNELEAYTPEETRLAAGQMELDGPLINARAKGIKVEFDGTETVGKQDCYRLKLTLKDGEVRRTWIDAKTFLEARTQGQTRHFNGKDRPVYTLLSNYKTVQGLVVAHRMETQVDGVPQTNAIVIDKVAFNPQLDAGRFMRPDRLQ
jgi:outer membrane lipoprotein-sorting protein